MRWNSHASEPTRSRAARAWRRDHCLLVLADAGLAHPRAAPARVPGGEVDIVAKRGRTLAFIEVKARSDESAAAFALDEFRLRRVAVAAERLMPRYMDGVENVRIDAIFIVPFRWPRHLVDVWQA